MLIGKYLIMLSHDYLYLNKNKKNSGSFEGLYRNHLYDSSIKRHTAKQ